MNKNLKIRIKKITALLLVLFFVFGFNFFSGFGDFKAKAASLSSNGEYSVKLKSAADFGLLLGLGNNIQHRFKGNGNQTFQNIYSFHSDLALLDLQKNLAGKYDYLETDASAQAAQVVVNDPGFSSDSQNIDKEWGLVKAGFNQAWEKTVGAKNNVVAIIDTGVDGTHEDLKNINYVAGFDFISKQAIIPKSNSDDNGHGTLVAGVLGATANNGIGIAGTNWDVSIMPIKALDSSGKGDADTIAEAIVWAADHGAQFVNLSVGGIGFGHDTTLANAVSYAFNKNVLLVSAAGNDINATGQNLDENPVFPVCDDNNYNMIIGVVATDQNDLKAEFSNYGRNCIDVAAPGKRILSTINFDPLSKKAAPNSYAYASGTSMAVPFVVGEALLIKAVYPTATNIQIRDRIISTADQIDSLNLSQCGGASCQGLLGAGRIDVPKSLEAAIAQNFTEGDLVKATDLGVVYQILGGQKRLVSSFVFNQKFSSTTVKTAVSSQLSAYPEGSYVTPNDGTLFKVDAEPAVYIMSNGLKMPVTYQIFQQRKFSFANVNTLSFAEVASWPAGSFLPPLEGTLIKTYTNSTVYWVIGQALHPVNFGFYMDRGLNIFPIILTPDPDIKSFASGESYIR